MNYQAVMLLVREFKNITESEKLIIERERKMDASVALLNNAEVALYVEMTGFEE